MQLSNKAILDLRDALSIYIHRWRRDPVAYWVEALQAHKYGYPTPQQAEILRALCRQNFVAVSSGHGVGKTRTLAVAADWHITCNRNIGEAVTIPCTAPTSKTVGNVWKEISLVQQQKLPFLRDKFIQTSERFYCVEAPDSCYAEPRTARPENPEALQGLHGNVLFLIDEAAGINKSIFTSGLGSFSESNARGLMFANPSKLSGYFYDCFHGPSRWHCMKMSCLDTLEHNRYPLTYLSPSGEPVTIMVNGRVGQQFVDDTIREFELNSPEYFIRVLGDFPHSEVDQLIKSEWIDRCFASEPSLDVSRPRLMGVDVAWQGTDRSSYVVRQGSNVEEVVSWHGNDPTETSEIVRGRYQELYEQGRPPRYVCVDVIGIGAGVYSNLRSWGIPALPVDVHTRPPEDGGTKCRLLRDWLWWQARAFFRDQHPHFCEKGMEMRKLAKELAMPNFEYRGGCVYVDPKDNIRKNFGVSPDLADALILTFYADWKLKAGKTHTKKRKAHGKQEQLAERWKLL